MTRSVEPLIIYEVEQSETKFAGSVVRFTGVPVGKCERYFCVTVVCDLFPYERRRVVGNVHTLSSSPCSANDIH